MDKSGAFISYARADGAAFAAALVARLAAEAADLRVWQDRPEIEGGVGWWRQIEQALERVEFLVIVLTPGALTSETTRKEWRAARQCGVCVFPVVGPGFDFGDPLLPGWMSRVHIYDVGAQWVTFLAHLRRGCTATRVPFMAPPLSASHVPRTREFAALHGLVIDARTQEALAVTATLTGAGGFGKTTLATALCHDDVVVTAFDDGVLWATLGQNPNIQGELTRLYASLTGERPGFVSIEDAAQALADKLEQKRCLIVIDDVWDVAHLKPFMRGGPLSARLVTTRQAPVAAEGSRIEVDEMSSQEAVALLMARLGTTPQDTAPLRRLSHRLGEWPLLLRLAGGALRQRVDRGDSLDGALRFVDRALDRRGVTAFDRERAGERDGAVASTLAVSLDLLADADRARCLQLAVFPEDLAIPVAVLGDLWGLDDFDTEDLLSRLHDGSLIEFDLGRGTVGVHDVMAACFADLLGPAVPVAHERLLAAWPDLRQLPHRYAWRWLGHHLAGAGRSAQFRALLLDFDWLRRKLGASDIYALLADFSFVPQEPALQLLYSALRMSSHVLSKDKSQLAAQLLARLAAPEQELSMTLEKHPPPGPWLRPLAASLVGPGGALVRTLESPGMPSAVAMTPDGQSIVACNSNGSLVVWELASGTLLRTLSADDVDNASIVRPGEMLASAFAMLPGGQVLLLSSRALAAWDPTADAPMRQVAQLSEVFGCLAVSHDGRQALLGSRKGLLLLVDLESGVCSEPFVAKRMDIDTGEPIVQRVAHRLGIAAVAFTSDGRHALTGSYDKTVRLWDLEHHALVDTLYPPHDGAVYALAAPRGASIAASGSADRSIRIWDLASQSCLATLSGHGHRVYDLAMSEDGTRALSASHDRTIRLWDVAAANTLATLHGHSDAVVSVAFVPGESLAVSAARDGTVRVWQLDAGEARAATQEHEGWIQAAAISSDGRLAVTGGQDHRLRIWDTAEMRVTQTLAGHQDALSAVALHHARRIVVSGAYDRCLIVWRLGEDHPVRILRGHADALSAVAISADGNQALSASADGDVILWDIERGRILRRWDGHRRSITFLASMPDWSLAFTGSMDGDIKAWDIATGTCLRSLHGHLGGVTAGDISAHGDSLLSGGADGVIRLWRLPSLEVVHSVQAHGDQVRCVRYAGNGQTAFSGSYDTYLKAWSIPALQLRASFAADSAIAAVAASESGETVVAGDAQGCAHFLRFG